jgi:hypothetical protein
MRDAGNGSPAMSIVSMIVPLLKDCVRARPCVSAVAHALPARESSVTVETIAMAAPLHNFGVPSLLNNRIEAISGAGVAFRYSEQGPEGLQKREVNAALRAAAV